MTFILIAIACCLEIYLPLFVTELVLPVACFFVASGKLESRWKMPKSGIETIEQTLSPRFRANSVVEAKLYRRRAAVFAADITPDGRIVAILSGHITASCANSTGICDFYQW